MGLVSSQISTKQLVPVCREMATSYSAGIPILRSLELVASGAKTPQVREVLMRMQDSIRRGSTLAQAAERESEYLPRFFIELLSSGETGGQLDVMLRDLASYYEDRLAMQRRIVGKMVYPILQLVAAWYLGSFALMLIKRMNFSDNKFSLEAYLHFYAKFQIGMAVVFGVAVVVCIILARMGLFGWVSGYVTTHMWPVANVTRKFAMARFFRSLSLLIGSGVPIVKCIESAAAVTANPYIERDLRRAIPWIQEGATLVAAFSGSRYLSPQAREMLAVGEESGQLEQALHKVAEYQMNEATHAVDIATRVMFVVVGLAVGLVIGYVVISFWANFYGGMFDELGI